MRKFRRQIPDPADGIAAFEKRFDEQHIGAMLSNKFIRLRKSMCGTANMVAVALGPRAFTFVL